MQLSDISWQTVILVAGVILFAAGVYTTLMSAQKVHREEEKRKSQPMEDVQRMLANDKARLDNHEMAIQKLNERTDAQDAELKLILRGQLALIRHGIDGNNINGLKE